MRGKIWSLVDTISSKSCTCKRPLMESGLRERWLGFWIRKMRIETAPELKSMARFCPPAIWLRLEAMVSLVYPRRPPKLRRVDLAEVFSVKTICQRYHPVRNSHKVVHTNEIFLHEHFDIRSNKVGLDRRQRWSLAWSLSTQNMPILDELFSITPNLFLIWRNFGSISSCLFWENFVFDFAKNSCFYCWLWWCQVTLFCPRARSSSCCPIQCLKSLVSNSTPPEANARPLLTTFILWPGKERRAASFWGRRLRPLWRVARLDHYQRLNLAQRMMVVI